MKKIINLMIILIVIIIALNIIQVRNFNGLKLGQMESGTSTFSRDKTQTYHGEESYKIESQNYSDAMYFQTIKTEKNSVYKVSCQVKTENVICEAGEFGGFNICLKDKTNKSPSLSGTNDWTEINFYFNSYHHDNIEIGFRLGENTGNCKGTVWICNFKIEKGVYKESKNWNFAVFIINHTDIKIGNETIKESMTTSQKNSIVRCMSRFKNTCEEFANGHMKIDYEIFDLNDTIKTLSYDEGAGYVIAQKDVYSIINQYVYDKNKNFDHIFIVANIGDTINNDKIDWLGLGGTLYDNIGFSNIRISGDTLKSYHTSSSNSFAEEVFLHEFLHTLEHNMADKGYHDIIALHDYEKYHYENKSREGLKKWYEDYMNSNISKNKIALTEDVYYTQPITEKSFRNSYELKNAFYEDSNFVQKISEKMSKIF